jgi:hypothetical protein
MPDLASPREADSAVRIQRDFGHQRKGAARQLEAHQKIDTPSVSRQRAFGRSGRRSANSRSLALPQLIQKSD